MSGQSGGMRTKATIQRAEFLERLRSLGDGPECVLWIGGLTPSGYARTKDHSRPIMAHRWVYEQIHGQVPWSHEPGARGPIVMHTCDNRACVRPSHLRLGTQGDNMTDAAAKGRAPNTKLSHDEVRQVREALARGDFQRDIAKRFGVSQSLVSMISTGSLRSASPAGA